MKSISIALVLVVAVTTCQTKELKLSELITLENQEESLCESCQMFISGINNVIEQAFDWVTQEMDDFCDDHFAYNSTATMTCKAKVDKVVEKIRDFVVLEDASEVICRKFYLC
ncbi:hypothetical protein QQG55_21020 [Brugia pahangi]|uniref:Saposin B-type domain-containing protein n=1 Tax=Brugia pahangi TaxID=6280 RepID=A0A0N4TF69_BRUPA|nr:unnamed protein product [Brugia pahangi]